MHSIDEYRESKDHFLKNDPHSPLPAEERESFTGLEYYPENKDLSFEVEVEPFDQQEHVHMQTSTGDLQPYLRFGTFSFEVDGQPATLTVYSSDNGGVFVPFADATSGSETYGAGRYLDLHWHHGDRLHVDFNLAYNPWCAYSPLYSCPIPPQENRLKVAVRAGEKDFKGQ